MPLPSVSAVTLRFTRSGLASLAPAGSAELVDGDQLAAEEGVDGAADAVVRGRSPGWPAFSCWAGSSVSARLSVAAAR